MPGWRAVIGDAEADLMGRDGEVDRCAGSRRVFDDVG